MINKLFSSDSCQGAFFRRIDWAAFWTATAISFLVYFYTLAPSVTLEDSGELATAGCHLGVPHPPGYPIWALCANVFSWLFSWVTFRGQPTPAWSIALMSGVFAALAAGFSAMLVTRSASDMLRDAHEGDVDFKEGESDLLCWAGGVGGSLAFAFSPVMWSQATIVEVYSLNAFFLMWIFLLSYRWMRRPSDKILWLTAFVFGLGMTNYQVLLLAALPLAVIIFLCNIALFRDFLLVGIPVLLTAHVLQIGSEMPAMPGMGGPAYPKFTPLLKTAVPSTALLVAGSLFVAMAVMAALVLDACRKAKVQKAWMKPFASLSGQGASVAAGLAAFGALLVFFSSASTKAVAVAANDAPLFASSTYTSVAGLIVLIFALCIGGAYAYKGKLGDKSTLTWLVPAGVMLLILFFRLSAIPDAPMPQGYMGAAFDWTLPTVMLVGALTVVFLLGATIPRGIFFAVSVAAVQIALFVMLRKGGMSGLTHPTTWWFWWPIIWNFVIIFLAWLMLPNGRSVSLTMLFAEVGVSFYIYMPIVSDLLNPPMNWGYPRTWEGFKHAVTRGQYEKIAPSDVFNKKFIFQLGSYFTDLRIQFTLIAATLGFLPFTLWSFKHGGRRIRAMYVAIALYLVTSFFVLLSEVMHGEPILRIDKLLIGLIMVLLLIGMITIVFRQAEEFVLRTWKEHNLSEGLTVGISLAGVAAGIGIFIAMGLVHALSGGAADTGMGLKLAALALAVVIMVAMGAGWYFFRKFAEEKFDFRSDMDSVTQQWIIATATGFLVMSVLMVALANIKGDLQDAFIQKVKFVSSHGIFAIWIGYGLVLGLAFGNRLFKSLVRRGLFPAALLKPVRMVMVCAAVLVSTIPIYENYTNEYLVFSMSGAEQNDHDYGWQFGNYQLRGADAITEELEADQEPLPDPVFPLPMEPSAIFFGGTDPGRFVPTYMIYSAKVRPDVFLITQNALADNTYMSTMRDLYGNPIWIPTPDDSARAFQVYVDEVQSGKRPKNAALTIENGRVQVSGALGVMEINGILCDMIFAKNKARHAFYIEESYVINWMFPYLSPHGLIMKINSEPQPLLRSTVLADMDFWDWYTRHLLRTPMFRRDLPAQKSFSKLRSAIAGLYAARGARVESERAFQEARILYPVSPEANFRLIQEVLLAQARYGEAIDLLSEYNQRDPNNDRGFGFIDFIKRVRDTEAKVRQLTVKAQTSKTLSPEDAFALALAYRDLGQNDSAANYLIQLAGIPNLPVEKLFEISTLLSSMKKTENAATAMDSVMARLPPNIPAEKLLEVVRIYGEAGKADKMGPPLSLYLQQRPNDWQAWLDMATLCAMKQQQQQMQFALQKAIELGKGHAVQRIQENGILRQAAAPFLQQLMQQGAGGLPPFGPLRGR
jgi:tetratricopeptide (TPR) repeat protein